jgi:hypothetical protein
LKTAPSVGLFYWRFGGEDGFPGRRLDSVS